MEMLLPTGLLASLRANATTLYGGNPATVGKSWRAMP
jgi:hypothetical protein